MNVLASNHQPFSLVRRWFAVVATMIAVAFAATFAVPTQAAETIKTLPFVNNFATARFKLLGTTSVRGVQVKTFGEGAVVLPDRTSAWIATDGSDLIIYIVQIGSTIYQKIGSDEWKKVDSLGNLQTQPVSAQFNTLQQVANSIIKVGSEKVGDVATTHYQVWVSGEKLLELSGASDSLDSATRELISKTVYKYDFWIGDADSFLHQQNVSVITPATTYMGTEIPSISSDTLMTFYDINDPNISVNAPN